MNDSGPRRTLPGSVERHRARRERWQRHGERPLGRNLAMIGSLGWLVVLPTLLGILAGRLADRRWDTGIFWTAALLLVGLVVGCWLAWRRVREE